MKSTNNAKLGALQNQERSDCTQENGAFMIGVSQGVPLSCVQSLRSWFCISISNILERPQTLGSKSALDLISLIEATVDVSQG